MPGELARMASIWRIDGVFWTCALKKWGQVFTRVGRLVHLYSVVLWEGITPFQMTGKFWRETFRVDLNENKRELDIFVEKYRKIIRPGILVFFL